MKNMPKAASPSPKQLSFLDKFLALWIFLSMALGILLGAFVPKVRTSLQHGQLLGVSAPIAVGLLVMMYPILCKVRYETLHNLLRLKAVWVQILLSLLLNWIIAPLFMLALAWAFLPDEPSLREGLIMVGIARCIAMVLIWTTLAGGDIDYCAMLVALNSLLQIVLFAPFTTLYINIMSHKNSHHISVSFSLVAQSVALFLGVPLAAAIVTRIVLTKIIGEEKYQTFIKWITPLSLLGLLFTIVILFASQSQHIIAQIVSVIRVSAPLVVYFLVIFFCTFFFCHWRHGRYMDRHNSLSDTKLESSPSVAAKESESPVIEQWSYPVSVTQSLTAASNNFELAIAVTVAIYGINSKQALAATVGPLIEVPVMLGLVKTAIWLRKRWKWN